MIGYNADLHNQVEQLSNILMQSEPMRSVLEKTKELGIVNYYVGAGCVAQTVWNYQLGLELEQGISDYDVVYYDDSDLSAQAEQSFTDKLQVALKARNIKLDVNNQARVHLWYKDYFGYDISAYGSVEEAINTWPTTATSVGVRLESSNLKVYAPFGLNDLFGLIVRANKAQITEKIYMDKVHKWSAKWPSLKIIPW
ncbi:MAG: nucleotidyltransferase family protein [Oscillospiraceae bacterium]|nr:nucleotidyltransferase family protein [Oscillospiraceae bacterium]